MNKHNGKIWWSELITRDVESALDFYERVAGWAWDELPQPDGGPPYYLALRRGRPVAGLMRMDWVAAMKDVTPQWCHFLAVDDVDQVLSSAKRNGGSVLRKPTVVKDVGCLALMRDASGAVVGLIDPA